MPAPVIRSKQKQLVRHLVVLVALFGLVTTALYLPALRSGGDVPRILLPAVLCACFTPAAGKIVYEDYWPRLQQMRGGGGGSGDEEDEVPLVAELPMHAAEV
ncbi:uncharacterized protein LOC62_07G009438 [Vanrija pseudolonga]|uniref:Uncharacterized protein n=1 Tax=Vanrija pseudolonga TaxID=143232 RepID=A0AAF1BRK0_9TREE|nr:hypothetical protein LOC62_07G009438 [Vanrija pseudolonga]